jgi:hypothetical protein
LSLCHHVHLSISLSFYLPSAFLPECHLFPSYVTVPLSVLPVAILATFYVYLSSCPSLFVSCRLFACLSSCPSVYCSVLLSVSLSPAPIFLLQSLLPVFPVLPNSMSACRLVFLSLCHAACLPVCHPVHPSIVLTCCLSVCRLLPSFGYSPYYLCCMLLSCLTVCPPTAVFLSLCHAACLSVCHPVHPSIALSGFLSVCRLLPSLCYSPSYLSFLLLSWRPLCLPAVLPVCLSYTPLVYLPVILSIRLLICLPFYHAVWQYSTSHLPCLLLSLPTEE